MRLLLNSATQEEPEVVVEPSAGDPEPPTPHSNQFLLEASMVRAINEFYLSGVLGRFVSTSICPLLSITSPHPALGLA